MRFLSWKTMAISVLIIFVNPAFSRDHHAPNNEDLKFVREWKDKQKAKEVHDALQLTEIQVKQLRDIKTVCDQFLDAAKSERQEIEKRRDEASRKLRAELEKTGVLSPELEKGVVTAHRDLRKLREKTKLELRLATLGLMDVFEPEQIRALKTHGQEAKKQGDKRERRSERGRFRRDHGKRRVARFLLSDAFLNQYP